MEPDHQESLWIRGGFPRSFLERDIPHLGIRIPAETIRRFWTFWFLQPGSGSGSK